MAFIVLTGTPKEITTLLHREIVTIIALPDPQERLVALSFESVGNTPEEAAALFKTANADGEWLFETLLSGHNEVPLGGKKARCWPFSMLQGRTDTVAIRA